MPGFELRRGFALCLWLAAVGGGVESTLAAETADAESRVSVVAEEPPHLASSNEWWAAKRLVKPEVPFSSEGHPIDAFVAAALRSLGLEWAPEAGPAVLLRRLTVDLHGLMPEPGAIRTWEGRSVTESIRLETERLLESPRYGERWARHWLDVVHFAETHGHDQDRPRESAWRYRDYVIEALNADTPYARFVQEQVAADALFPDEPGLTPALGFLAAGPWDESSLRDIREDTLDREIGRYLDRDDIVANVFSTFTATTVHCARCHDHKFDPIPQTDYYALQAVFAGTEKAERLYDLEPGTNARRQEWMRLQVAIERSDRAEVERLMTPALRKDFAEWEQESRVRTIPWRVVRPEDFASQAGTELRRLDDDSLLAGGASPAKDVYTVVTEVELGHVTAVRLELLPDDSLPAKGPGRAANGNLHLTGFRVFCDDRQLLLRNATSDFDQAGWEAEKAIDDDPETGWGIHPQEGRAHQAVFEFEASAGVRPGGRLRFELEQGHGREHTIGRFRLSLTDQPPPVRASPWPEDLARVLAKADESRTLEERFAMTAYYLRGRIDRELASLPSPLSVYAGANVFLPNAGQKALGRPREVHVLRRGEVTQPRDEAGPGALSCVTMLESRFARTADEAQRRAALARWLTDRENPFTWRTIVNRAWQYHFGRGLVATPNDFGRMGASPIDSGLLDWLAVTFRDELGGSLKKLHALMLSSRAWRQEAADPGSANPFQPLRRRMDAETFRDSLLAAAGRLDLTMGGPSVKQFAMSEGIHVTPNVDYAGFDVDSADSRRRSVYRFIFRTLPDPLMDSLDCPSGDQSMPARSESFTALQAFALMNHPLVMTCSEHFGRRVESMGSDEEGRVRAAFELVFQRGPTSAELESCSEHARSFGFANLGRLLFNSNEFHFIE